MIAVSCRSPADAIISMYSLSHFPSFNRMSILSSVIYCLPSSSASGVRSFSTSNWYSLLPMSAPRAMAMGSPIIPVPGIPTPMAFFRILALSRATIFSGLQPNCSLAFAVHRATAIGSVHPIAGTTSLCTKAIICSRISLLIIDF